MDNTKQPVDLSSLDVVKDANAGVEIELYHPGTRAPLGIFVTVVGKDSTEFRKASIEQNRRRIKKMTKGGQFKMQALEQEEIEADTIHLLAVCTKGWRNMALDGKPLEFSVGNAEMLYERFPWIREEIDEAVGDRALFTRS